MKPEIQIDLLKLADGARLLRLSEATSGLSLEKKLDASEPVARQKDWLLREFETLLSHQPTAGAA